MPMSTANRRKWLRVVATPCGMPGTCPPPAGRLIVDLNRQSGTNNLAAWTWPGCEHGTAAASRHPERTCGGASLPRPSSRAAADGYRPGVPVRAASCAVAVFQRGSCTVVAAGRPGPGDLPGHADPPGFGLVDVTRGLVDGSCRSEEHTSELQSLMRISYAVFCLKKKNIDTQLI